MDGTNGNDEISMGANIYRDGTNAFATTPRGKKVGERHPPLLRKLVIDSIISIFALHFL